MAFAQGPTVLHIKLTDKGRQLLSTGQLTFKKYALGDSEIDYEFNKKIEFSTFNQKILRPKDNNPDIVDFIEQTVSGDTIIDLPTTVSNTSVITNTAKEKGFFATGSTGYKLQTEETWVKNSGGKIYISGVTGGLEVTVRQSDIYQSSSEEPIVGDYLMVKWANPYLISGTTTVEVDEAVPYVWYKISGVTGSLASDNLLLTLDTPLPNFNGNGGDIESAAYIYPNSNNREVSGDSIQTYYGSAFTTDFLNDAVFSFIENWDCISQDETCEGENEDVPVWNMGIIFTEEIEGVKETDYNYTQYYTKELGGFVRYIQQISPWIKKIGVVHYTNKYPYNVYGEGLIENGSIPTLELPTLMWHKESGSTIGVTLQQSGAQQTLSGLSTQYFDLTDDYGNVVGKVFNDLQVFVIEDQELLFAMSYKANRSWTLPEFTAALNVSLCPESDVECEIITTTTTTSTTTTTAAPTTTTSTTAAPTTTTTAAPTTTTSTTAAPTTTTSTTAAPTTAPTTTTSTTAAVKTPIYFSYFGAPTYIPPFPSVTNNSYEPDGTVTSYYRVYWTTDGSDTQGNNTGGPSLTKDVDVTIDFQPYGPVDFEGNTSQSNISGVPTSGSLVTASPISATLTNGTNNGYFSVKLINNQGSSFEPTNYEVGFSISDVDYKFGVLGTDGDSEYVLNSVAGTSYGYLNGSENSLAIEAELASI